MAKNAEAVGKLTILSAVAAKLDSVSDILESMVEVHELLLEEDAEFIDRLKMIVDEADDLAEMVHSRLEDSLGMISEQMGLDANPEMLNEASPDDKQEQ